MLSKSMSLQTCAFSSSCLHASLPRASSFVASRAFARSSHHFLNSVVLVRENAKLPTNLMVRMMSSNFSSSDPSKNKNNNYAQHNAQHDNPQFNNSQYGTNTQQPNDNMNNNNNNNNNNSNSQNFSNVPPIEDDTPRPKASWKEFLSPSGLIRQYKAHKGSFFTYGVAFFVGVTIYNVVKAGLSIADFFVTTSFYDVATISFTAGLATAGVIAVILSYTRRLFIIRPELVYQSVLAKVKSDQRVVDMLGSNIQAGKFRAYSLSDGGVQLVNQEPENKQYQGWERFWKPRKLQMMFQLEGSREKGMVSFEAKKEFNGDMLFMSLTLDGLQSGEKLILEGDGSNKVYRGVIKLR